MTVLISSVGRDRKAAASLEKFLKGQAMAVRTSDVVAIDQHARDAGSIIMIWSRNVLGAAQSRFRSEALLHDQRSAQRVILVNLDGSELPNTILNSQVIDARSVGLRQSRAWRLVASMARGRCDSKRSTVEANRAPEQQSESLTTDLEAGMTLGRLAASSQSAIESTDKELTRPILPLIILLFLMIGLTAATWLMAGQQLIDLR